MSKPSFLDWYPRGRLALLGSTQSKDLKSRIQFAESIASALLIFIKVKSDLQTILDAWSFSNKNGDFPSFRLPSEFHISPDPQDLSSSQLDEASRSCLLLTDYVCRFSSELFFQLVQHPIFQKALEDNPELVSISSSPVLIFDRAIYAIGVGNGVERLIIESSFPPLHFDPDFGIEGHSEEAVFVDSTGETSALIERDESFEIFPVIATRPFVSRFNEENKNSINDFLQSNTLVLLRLLEKQALIISNLSDYFTNRFESSVNLLKNREDLWHISVDGIDA
jgi:hypothetical protein